MHIVLNVLIRFLAVIFNKQYYEKLVQLHVGRLNEVKYSHKNKYNYFDRRADSTYAAVRGETWILPPQNINFLIHCD
jgi:hypothetical protein